MVLLEAAVRQYEQVLDVRSPMVSGAARRAEQLLDALNHQQRQQVSTFILPCSYDSWVSRILLTDTNASRLTFT